MAKTMAKSKTPVKKARPASRTANTRKLKSNKTSLITMRRALIVLAAIVGIGIVIRLTQAATTPPVDLRGASAPAGYTLKFGDEFDGTTLNTAKWNNKKSNYGTGNKEDQCFLPENVQVSGGNLNLIAKRIAGSSTTCGTNPEGGGKYHFTSGWVSTRPSEGSANHEFKHGYFEARIKMPQGNPFWLGWWLVGGSDAPGGWPSYGEMDIAELISAMPDTTTGTFHYSTTLDSDGNGVKNDPNHKQTTPNLYNMLTGSDSNIGETNKMLGVMSSDFHRYGLLWEDNRIVWYFDGIPFRAFYNDGKIYNLTNNGQTATLKYTLTKDAFDTFNRQHTILLTNSVGGNFPRRQGYTGIENSDGSYNNGNLNVLKNIGDTSTTLIDYVRVYQYTGGTTTTNNPPLVSLTSPSNGQTFNSAPASVVVSANAEDADGIKGVEFFDGTTSLGTDVSAPYSITVSASAGSHTYSAKATDSSSSSLSSTSNSSAITVNTATSPAPVGTLDTPTGLKATPGNGQVNLTWTAVTGANNYTVKWGTSGSFTNYSNSSGVQYNPTSNTYTVMGLLNGTNYNFSVAARDTTGKSTGSAYSTAVNAAPGVTVNPPTGLSLKPKYDSSAVFDNPQRLVASWTKSTSPNITRYEMYVNDKYYAPFVPTATSTSIKITSGWTYKVSVLAVDSSGQKSVAAVKSSQPVCSWFSCKEGLK